MRNYLTLKPNNTSDNGKLNCSLKSEYQRLLNIQELSEWLNCSSKTIYNWVYRAEIPYRKIGRRLLRFDRREIEQWLAEGRC